MGTSLPLDSSAPLDVELDITAKCQLDCAYCSAAPLLGAEIPTEKAIALLHELKRLKVFTLLLSGGEPTLHPGFLQICELACKCVPSVSVNTNGIRLANKSFAEKVCRAAPRAMFSISLDSLNSSVNTAQRGKAAGQAIAAINNCVALGQSVNISCVLTERNIAHAHEIIEAFYPRVRKFSFFPRVPRCDQELLSDVNGFREAMSAFTDRIEGLRGRYQTLEIMLPTRKLAASNRGQLFETVAGCCCAYTRLYINVILDVYPCYYSAGPDTLLGSIANSTLQELWLNDKAGRIRILAKERSLCGMVLGRDSVPYRYKNAQHIKKVELYVSSGKPLKTWQPLTTRNKVSA